MAMCRSGHSVPVPTTTERTRRGSLARARRAPIQNVFVLYDSSVHASRARSNATHPRFEKRGAPAPSDPADPNFPDSPLNFGDSVNLQRRRRRVNRPALSWTHTENPVFQGTPPKPHDTQGCITSELPTIIRNNVNGCICLTSPVGSVAHGFS